MAEVAPLEWSEGVRRYLSYARLHLARLTVQRVEPVLDRFGALARPALVADVTLEQLEAYQASRVREVKAASVNAELRHLAAFLAWLRRRGHLARNPARRMEVLPVDRREPVLVEVGDLQRIIGTLLAWRRTWTIGELALLVANTGLRLGEALALRGEDVTSERLHLRCRDGTGPKRRRERFVPLNAVAQQLALRRSAEVGKDGYLFRSRGGRPIAASNALKALKLAARRAGIDAKGVTWQAMRRTFATALAPEVNEASYVAIMGHSLRVAREWYLAASRQRLPKPPVVVDRENGS